MDVKISRYRRYRRCLYRGQVLGALFLLDEAAGRPDGSVEDGADGEDTGDSGAETEQEGTEGFVVLLPVDDFERADVEVKEEPRDTAAGVDGVWVVVIPAALQRSVVLRGGEFVCLDLGAVEVLKPGVDDLEEVRVHLVLVVCVDASGVERVRRAMVVRVAGKDGAKLVRVLAEGEVVDRVRKGEPVGVLVEEGHVVDVSAAKGDGGAGGKVEVPADPVELCRPADTAALLETGIDAVDVALPLTLLHILAIVELPPDIGVRVPHVLARVAAHLLLVGLVLVPVLVHGAVAGTAVPVRSPNVVPLLTLDVRIKRCLLDLVPGTVQTGLCEPVLEKIELDVPSQVHHVETNEIARQLREGDVQVDVEMVVPVPVHNQLRPEHHPVVVLVLVVEQHKRRQAADDRDDASRGGLDLSVVQRFRKRIQRKQTWSLAHRYRSGVYLAVWLALTVFCVVKISSTALSSNGPPSS